MQKTFAWAENFCFVQVLKEVPGALNWHLTYAWHPTTLLTIKTVNKEDGDLHWGKANQQEEPRARGNIYTKKLVWASLLVKSFWTLLDICQCFPTLFQRFNKETCLTCTLDKREWKQGDARQECSTRWTCVCYPTQVVWKKREIERGKHGTHRTRGTRNRRAANGHSRPVHFKNCINERIDIYCASDQNVETLAATWDFHSVLPPFLSVVSLNG